MSELGHCFAARMSAVSVFIGQCCGMFYLAAILLSGLEVLLRYAFNAPSVWNMEIVMVLCASAWLFSGCAVTQQHRHITVTVMELIVGERIWRVMSKIANSIALLAVLGLIWAFWEPASHVFVSLERSGSAMDSPFPSFIRVATIIAAAAYALQLLANLLSVPKADQAIGTGADDIATEVKE